MSFQSCTHRGVEQTDTATFLPPPPFFFSPFLPGLEPNGSSPGDSFLSVRDENEKRERDREGGRHAENKTGSYEKQ